MLRKLFAAALVITLAACCWTGAARAAEGLKYVVKMAHTAAPENVRHFGAEQVKTYLETHPDINFEVQIYPTSQLGNDRELVEGMQLNNIEMVVLPCSPLGGFQPLVTMMDLPFFLPGNKEALFKLYESPAMRTLWDTTEEVGFKILGAWHTGYKQFSGNKPLVTLGDFKGLNIRCQSSPILIRTIQALGANAVTLPFAEVYSAMQTQAVDAHGDAPVDTIYDMKFNEVQSDITYTNHGTQDMLLLASKGWYDALPAAVQKAVSDAVKEANMRVVEECYGKAEKDTEIMKKQGTKFHTPTAEGMTGIQDATKVVKEYFRSQYGERGQKLMDEMEKTIAALK